MSPKITLGLLGLVLALPGIGVADEPKVRRTFRLETSDVLLGEPILVEYRIAVNGPGVEKEAIGGSRGLGRDGRFFFLMRHEDGEWVPDLFEGHQLMGFGGKVGGVEVEQGKSHSDWLAVQQWCAIDRAGVYQLYAFHMGGKADPPAIPGAVKARYPRADRASQFAEFKVTARRGDATERRAMVERWIGLAANADDWERTQAARNGMAFARQDDFLPDLKRRLRQEQWPTVEAVYLGLAMRDDPRAVDLLFESGTSEALEVMPFLRPSQVPAAIPRWIEGLASEHNRIRASSEEMLRRWTGLEIGHTWRGYNHIRPTLEEGRAMQPAYRTWWQANKGGFRPRFR